MSVVDTLSDIKRRVGEELKELDGSAALENLRVRVLGKKGELTALLKGMGQLAPEERPRVGAQINEVRQWLTERMDEAQARIRAAERAANAIEDLPDSLEHALVALKADPLMAEVLGPHIFPQYVAGKEKEWQEYCTRVSSWEIAKYMVLY